MMTLKLVRALLKRHKDEQGALFGQRGAVLIVVMVAMTALVILGVTLSTVAINDQRQASRQEKNNEAYYLARSGAEAAAAVLLERLNNNGDNVNIDDLLDKEPPVSDLGNGRFEVVLEKREEDGAILIHSTGYSGDYTERVTLSLLPGDEGGGGGSSMISPDMAVFSNSTIDVSGSAKIFGKAGTNYNYENPGAVSIDWGSYIEEVWVGEGGDPKTVVVIPKNSSETHYSYLGTLEEKRDYWLPVFPKFPDLALKGDLVTSSSRQISEDGHYDIIEVREPLIIKTSGVDSVIKIRVRELIFGKSDESKIVIEGPGTLELYIEEKIHPMSGSSSINLYGNINQVKIFYGGDNTVTFGGDALVRGYFFSDSEIAVIELPKGGAGIYGALFIRGPAVNISGGNAAIVSVLYAPNANVHMTRGGNLSGAIVCNSYYASGGGAIVTYNSAVGEIWEGISELDFEVGSDTGDVSNPSISYQRGAWTD